MRTADKLIIVAGVISYLLSIPAVAYTQQDLGKGTGKAKGVMLTRQPEFPGGLEEMTQFISKNMKYPVQAREQKITGTVTVKVMVEETGALTKPMVKEGIGWGCDEEAVRLVKVMPKWVPGESEGKVVRTETEIAVIFMLFPVQVKRTKRASDLD
jgi:TonB family protein